MNRERNLKTLAYAIIAAGVIALIVLIVYMLSPVRREQASSERAFEAVQNAPEQDAVLGEARVDSISIPGFGEMNIPAETTDVATDIYNPEKNHCFFQVTIVLTDEQKQIYQSELIRPGQHLYNITLSQGMPKGSYDAILHYDTFSMNDYTPLNGANVPFTLNVN